MKPTRRAILSLGLAFPAARLLTDRPARAALPSPVPEGSPEILDSYLLAALHRKNMAETTYPGYRRIKIPRTPAAWDVIKSGATNRNEIWFPTCIGGYEPLSLVSIMDPNGKALFYFWLKPTIHVSNGITPIIVPGGLNISLPDFTAECTVECKDLRRNRSL